MKRNLLAALFGVLVTAALPPVYIWPLASVGLCGFFLMINQAADARSAFKLGWWFGFGHFTAGLYWIAVALLVDASTFGWMIPFAVFGIPAVVAIYTGFVALITFRAKKYLQGSCLVIFFACIWTIIEMLRGTLFTGFPWNLIGYIWTASDNMLQFASIGGIWALSLLTVLVFTMPALYLMGDKKPLLPVAIAFAAMIAIFSWGGIRLASAEIKYVPGVKLRIVQANIPQTMKWDEEWRYSIVQKYFNMSMDKGYDSITHIIWPETALPFTISQDSGLLNELAKIAPKKGAVITGSLTGQYTDSGVLKQLFNSMVVVSSDAKLYSSYNKSHLVPFGEYVPFRSILPIEKITGGMIDFGEGDGPRTIEAPGLPPFSPLICYEVIFPGKVIDKAKRPQVLINVTNDAWYGKSAGPYQHFEMARTRAVEEGIPLVRSANDGISAVTDGYGRIIGKTGLATTEILDSFLPVSDLNNTVYGRYGNIIVIAIMIALLIPCAYRIYGHK